MEIRKKALYQYPEAKESIEKIDQQISQYKEAMAQYIDVSNQIKRTKAEVKSVALKSGVITKKTMNNAVKYMREDLNSIKNLIDSALSEDSEKDGSKTEDIKKVENKIKSVDRKSWKTAYNKIKSCSKEVSWTSKLSRKAILDACSVGQDISSKTKVIESSSDIAADTIDKQKAAYSNLPSEIEAKAKAITKKYCSNDKENKKKALSLILSCIVLSAQTYVQLKLVPSINSGSAEFGKIDFLNFDLRMKNSPEDTSSGDIKKRYMSLWSSLIEVLKNIVKSIATVLLWVGGAVISVILFFSTLALWLGSGHLLGFAFVGFWNYKDSTVTAMMWKAIRNATDKMWDEDDEDDSYDEDDDYYD